MSDTYRAMCAELVDALENARRIIEGADGTLHINTAEFVLRRARALLAEAVAEGPSDDEWDALVVRAWDQYETVGYQGERFMYDSDFSNALDLVRQELARWGRPTPQPVATSERLAGPDDCDAEGRCWWLKQRANPDHDLLMPTWHLQRQGPVGTTFFRFTHWLPANALPTPDATNDY